ncbi:MAG TPA: hypothetical protein VJK51_03335 [Candidatus Nanoarchaeia archaeon]|nr:hypothetical protein [Candidatus Nanoarchaeia archaeon]
MVYSSFLAPFGWGVFFIGLVVAIVLYAVRKRFYPVMYLISVSTYIFTVGFVIDAFDMEQNGILLMLALSAVIFILLGMYFSYKMKKHKAEMLDNLPRRR